MADGGNILAIVQAVDLEIIVQLVDRSGLDQRFADVVTVTDEISLGLELTLAFDDSVTVSDAAARSLIMERSFADDVTVSDVFDRTTAFELAFADAVEVTDSLSANMAGIIGINLADAVTLVDAGVLQHYDYAAADYFLTPVDYVSQQRVF